ncbi:MAG: M56 family metallopeptidase [Huintestinicola sp.]
MVGIFQTVLDMSITGAYIAVAVILIRLIMKGLPKKYSYALWSILGIRLLCPFSFSSAASLFNLFDLFDLISPKTAKEQMTYIPEKTEYIPVQTTTPSLPLTDTDPVMIDAFPSAAAAERVMSTSELILTVSAAVWLIGAAVMLIYTAVSYVKVGKTVAGSRKLEGNIYICKNIGTPFVYGIAKPKIYVPEDVSELDMQYISAHEQTHIKRGDHIIKLIAVLALSIHWFNPLVWISYRLMVKDMELSCDEKAVLSFEKDMRKEYAGALLNMSLKQNNLSGILAFGESSIKTRIKSVLSLKKPTVIATFAAVAVIAAAALCLLTDGKKQEKFEDFGKYITKQCIYTSEPELIEEMRSGQIFEMIENSFTISKIGAYNDFPETYPLSEWTDIPYSAKEWKALFGDESAAADLSGYKEKLYMKLSDIYSLMKMDGTLWFVRFHDSQIMSIYALEPYYEYVDSNYNSSLNSFEITKTEDGYEVRSPLTDIYFFFTENEYENLYVRRDADGTAVEAVYPYLGGFNPYHTELELSDITYDGTNDIFVSTFITGTGIVDNVAMAIDGKTMEEVRINRLEAEKMISDVSEELLKAEDFDSLDPHITGNMSDIPEELIYPYYPDKSVRRFGGMMYDMTDGVVTGRAAFGFVRNESEFSELYTADIVFDFNDGELVPISISYGADISEPGIITSPEAAAEEYLTAINGSDNIIINEMRIGQISDSVVWQYKYPPLSEQYGLTEESGVIQVIASYTANGSEQSTVMAVESSAEQGFKVIDSFPYEPHEFTGTVTEINETARDGSVQFYMVMPDNGSEAVRVYSFAMYGSYSDGSAENSFNVGDKVTVQYNGELKYGRNEDNRILGMYLYSGNDTAESSPYLDICKRYLTDYWNDFSKTGGFFPENYISDPDMLRLANARKAENADTIGHDLVGAEAVIDKDTVQSGMTSEGRLWVYFIYDVSLELPDGTSSSEYYKGYSSYFELDQTSEGYEIFREYQLWGSEREAISSNDTITLPLKNADIVKAAEIHEAHGQSDYVEMQMISLISDVWHADEYGYSPDPDDKSKVEIRFVIPYDWVMNSSTADRNGKKVFELGVPYPESEGINYDGFKTDDAYGRDITVHEEKLGGNDDPFVYYIYKSTPDKYSDDDSYDAYVYVVSRGGYNISMHFLADSGIDREVFEQVLRSVNIIPLPEEDS